MHFFLSCLCWEYRQSKPAVFGPGKRDIQFNKESLMKRSCWTHGESVQARLISPFWCQEHRHGLRPELGPVPIRAHPFLYPRLSQHYGISFFLAMQQLIKNFLIRENKVPTNVSSLFRHSLDTIGH